MSQFSAKSIGLNGSAFTNGKHLGEMIANDPALLRFLQKGLIGYDDFDLTYIDIFTHAAEQYLPALPEELSGCSQVLNIPYEKLCYYAFRGAASNNCSQFIVLPAVTKDGHVYAGHNYDWTVDDEHIHAVNYTGKTPYMGFTLFYFGRWNGFNAHGLSVNQTGLGGAITERPQIFPNHLFVRILLEHCRCVEEAIELFAELPKAGWGGTMGIADAHGHAALVNYAASAYAVERIEESRDLHFIHSTNHYTLPSMYEKENFRGVHSLIRYQAIEEWIRTAATDIDQENLKQLLSAQFPNGPCCHYYADGLGTIRSVLYDLTDRYAEICFGSPACNPWHHMNFSRPRNYVEYAAVEYQDEVADAAIWKKLPPGAQIFLCSSRS
jgi:predicted choloylglycine hydrolase